MLKLYTLFHCNLAFSSIPSHHYGTVIERCYRPLLDMCEEGLPVAIEMPAWTLKEVSRIDPGFVDKLSRLWAAGKCEFIGSGYSQAIFPLIPVEVNRWNLETGNRYYKELLGRAPNVALVNEQTCSRGVIDLYREAGYGSIIMDWNNCYRFNHYPKEYLYHPQTARGIRSEATVLWSNSIAFQKFQRCIHGEITEAEYIDWLFSHSEGERAFVVYSNDAEVFDYRPGAGPFEGGEFEKIGKLLKKISADGRAVLSTPSKIIRDMKEDGAGFNLIRLESPETPVVCKKQDKYNPVRWAAAGRDSVHINTECHKVYENIKDLLGSGLLYEEDAQRFKEELCLLWSSDFRTNTIDEKFRLFQDRLGWVKVETERLLQVRKGKPALAGAVSLPMAALAPMETGQKAQAAPSVITGKENTLLIKTPEVECEFIANKGFAIKSLRFPGVSSRPLIGTLAHGYYEDIHLGADFFSGHLIHQTRDGKKTTDLKPLKPEIIADNSRVTITVEAPLEIGTLWKTFNISKISPEVSVTYKLKVSGLHASSLRPGIFTFMPGGFDIKTLWFETVNGGPGPERFHLKGKAIDHDGPVSQSVSATSCLGATEGWVRFGDGEKTVEISTDKSRLYSVPMIKFRELPEENSFFLRLIHSIGEFDDTAWWVWRGYNEITFNIKAERNI